MASETPDDKDEPLPPGEQWRLDQAEGYLALDMTAQAEAQIGRIAPPWNDRRPVVAARIRCAMARADWPAGAALARTARARWPDGLELWIWLAYCLRRAESVGAAREVLEEAAHKFPRAAIVFYNLACYACRLDRRDAALAHLAKAFALDPGFLDTALDDEDLAPLRPHFEP